VSAPANPNPSVNGWCPTCEEWAVRGRRDQCMFCDTPLTDGALPPTPVPRTSRHDETEQSNERSVAMTTTNGGTRNGDAILGDALEELNERKRLIEPLLAELQEVERAIKVLEKATGRGAAKSAGGGRRGGAREVPDELRDRIVTAVAAAPDALAVDAIADRIGQSKGPYLYSMLKQLEERGDLVRIDGAYAAPAAPVT
jgi:hypothetical protein